MVLFGTQIAFNSLRSLYWSRGDEFLPARSEILQSGCLEDHRDNRLNFDGRSVQKVWLYVHRCTAAVRKTG